MSNQRVSIGLDLHAVSDLSEALDFAVDDKFDFVSAPIFHPRFQRDASGISDKRMGPLTRSDTVLDSGTWSSCVVGKLSEWLNLDSADLSVRTASEKAFKQEMAFASHLSVPAVLAPPPTFASFNYAHLMNQTLQSSSFIHVWLRVPVSYATEAPLASTGTEVRLDAATIDSEAADTSQDAGETKEEGGSRGALRSRPRKDPWEAWNNFRLLCESHPNLSVALELTGDLPPSHMYERWLGEPVKAAIIPTSVFMLNKEGLPVLLKGHREFVRMLHKHKVQFLLSGKCSPEKGWLPYVQSLASTLSSAPPPTEQEKFEAPYRDYLQAPLQPLMDNLESQTYETFEKDPVKYREYERAVYRALSDTPQSKTSVVMVVGAGRGPLVRASLRAAHSAKRTIRVYAVEKNPNAVITLRNMVKTERWEGIVTVVSSDMRVWDAPEKADILVSELLGSFGDNELSPECLDGAQKFLKPDGISIPAEYTSFVAPVMSSKLWNEVKTFKDLKHFETAYVVKLFNFRELAKAKPAFRFVHPNPEQPADNSRYITLNFTSKYSATIHGFAGYFETKLYKEVMLSINPETFSDGMFSWFPIYFPLRHPMYVSKGDTIQIQLWRRTSPGKVWYEWAFTSPSVSPIHNPVGRSYWIGL